MQSVLAIFSAYWESTNKLNYYLLEYLLISYNAGAAKQSLAVATKAFMLPHQYRVPALAAVIRINPRRVKKIANIKMFFPVFMGLAP